MLFGLGEREGKGAGDDWDGLRGAGVSPTGLGGIGALRDGPWTEAGGDGSRSGLSSSGLWVEARVLGCAGMGVEAEEFIVLLG